MAKGIQNMAGDTKCGSPLAIFCVPTQFVAAHLAIFCIPHTLCGVYIIWRYTGAGVASDLAQKV